MRSADHVTLHFSNIMSTAIVFLDTEKAFETTWHSGLLNVLPELEFSTSLIKPIASFLTDRIFKVLVESGFSNPRKVAADLSQGSILGPIVQYICIYKRRGPRQPELPRVSFWEYD
jgi:hypothetical protein